MKASRERAGMRARRSPLWVVAGMLAIALGGLGGTALWAGSTQAHPVVKVAHDVARGDVVADTDLVVVQVPDSGEFATVDGGQIDSLVGRTATSDLAAGSLLAPDSIGDDTVAPGTVHLGLRLAPGRLPSTAVRSGSRIKLIGVPAQGQTAQEEADAPDQETFEAVAVSSATQDADGAWTLDVSVPADRADRVAALAATERLVVVRQADR